MKKISNTLVSMAIGTAACFPLAWIINYSGDPESAYWLYVTGIAIGLVTVFRAAYELTR